MTMVTDTCDENAVFRLSKVCFVPSLQAELVQQ